MNSTKKSVFERFDLWLTNSNPPWKAGLLVAVVVMVAGGLVVVLIPEMLASLLPALADYSPTERTDWIDSVRTGLLGVIAFGTVAAWVTQYRQSVLSRTVDQYTEGVRQLSQSTWEQAAAIRDLEGIATTHHDLRVKTLQMLAVFVRQTAPRDEALRDVSTAKPDKGGPFGKRRPEPGVQEALRVIGSHLGEWAGQPQFSREDIADAREVALGGELADRATPPGDSSEEDGYVSLADIAIDGAVLRHAQLERLNLRRSLMRDVRLERANLSGAFLREAVLSDADLERAVLIGTSLALAKLNRADLRRANLHGADLHEADLHGADLHEADLSGAHLWGAVGVSDQLKQANGKPHCLPGDSECRKVPEPGAC